MFKEFKAALFNCREREREIERKGKEREKKQEREREGDITGRVGK